MRNSHSVHLCCVGLLSISYLSVAAAQGIAAPITKADPSRYPAVPPVRASDAIPFGYAAATEQHLSTELAWISEGGTTGSAFMSGYGEYYGVPEETRRSRQTVILQSVKNCLAKWMRGYMGSLERHPLLTKAMTAAVVGIIGDQISQHCTAHFASQLLVNDHARTLCFALVGFLFNAPFLHTWYGLVAKFGNRMQQVYKLNGGQRIVAELALDQSLGVFVYYPLFFYAYELISSVVNGRAPQFLPLTVGGLGPIFAAIAANYVYWPFSQAISFCFVPESFRVLHTNLAAILWNIYFCATVAKG